MNKKTFTFLSELKLNNNRDWFLKNKSDYDNIRLDFESDVEHLLTLISTFDSEIQGVQTKQ